MEGEERKNAHGEENPAEAGGAEELQDPAEAGGETLFGGEAGTEGEGMLSPPPADASAEDPADGPGTQESADGSGATGAKEKKTGRAHRVNLIVNIVAAVILLAVFVGIFIYFYDEIQWLGTPEGREDFIGKLRGTGVLGVIILTLIQILQVVVAFIPGEVVELASGALYGVFGGLVLCLVGLNIGTLIIFGLVRLLGGAYVRENVSKKQYKYLQILNDPDRALVALFFIFLIPGIPKDILIYFIPLTRVKMWKFMIVSSVARIPSIVSSTFTAEAALRGDYLSAGIIFGIFLVLGVLGLIFNKQIYALAEKIFVRKKQD